MDAAAEPGHLARRPQAGHRGSVLGEDGTDEVGLQAAEGPAGDDAEADGDGWTRSEVEGPAGVLVTIAALLLHVLALYLAGSAAAGLGFGAATRSAVGALAEAAPAQRRGQVFATLYIASYLAFSVPALAAGLAVERCELEPTAVVYGAVDVVLVLIAALVAVRRSRRQHGEHAPRRHASSPAARSGRS